MNAPRKTYRQWDPEAYRHHAHAPDAKLPEDDLVFFLLDVVPHLDLSKIYAPYEDQLRGAPPFDPRLMTCLLLYAYAVGVYSSRKIALACERNLAFLAIVGDDRPDFRTISDFRKLHQEAFAELFLQVLQLAHEAGLVQLGLWATDGSKVPGNASRHKAMSYDHLHKESVRLQAEIADLLTQAQQLDSAEDAVLGSRAATSCLPSCVSRAASGQDPTGPGTSGGTGPGGGRSRKGASDPGRSGAAAAGACGGWPAAGAGE